MTKKEKEETPQPAQSMDCAGFLCVYTMPSIFERQFLKERSYKTSFGYSDKIVCAKYNKYS